jgi:uncharacterized protein HemY
VEAEQAYQQSLAIEREIKDRVDEVETLNALGRLYFLQHRWEEGSRAFKQAEAISGEFKGRA